MNYKLLGKILGKIMILEGALMLVPFVISIIYSEGIIGALAFVIPAVALLTLGSVLQLLHPSRAFLYQKEGFALVAIVWVVMGVFGAFPFVINGDIPNYVDALFEIISGFTTTGASIIDDISAISHSSLFWRSFSHWIGGMGILVFVLIFIPESNDGSSMHLLRAESPGPQVGKIVSKMKVTTRILYLIYLGMTVLEVVFLMFAKPLEGYESEHLFFSFLTAFGCAGTGGFGFVPGSMELMNPYTQYVIATFLLLFGVNFSIYYLILIGKVREAFKSEELKFYGIVVFLSIAFIFISLLARFDDYPQAYTVEQMFRHSYFQVASIITTAGFSTTDFNVWPMLARMVLFVLMFTGAMAGSTAGGMKLSRFLIAGKGIYVNIRKLINPRYVPKTKLEGKSLEEKTVNDVFAFSTLYLFFIIAFMFILAFDPVNLETVTIVSDAGTYEAEHGIFTNFSAVLACLSNVGPGFDAVSAYSSYSAYSAFSKLALSFAMLLGRLEILPVLILFNHRTWKKT